MKQGFTALQMNACGFGCVPNSKGTRLGVGCSDPYSVGLNASQCGLGPRSALNPYTGEIPSGFNMASGGGCSSNYPSRNHRNHDHDGISHRLQVRDVDLLRSLNPGASYFVEAQYITPHEFEAANGNQLNNVSHRAVSVSDPDDSGVFTFTNLEPTVREQPAITAWTDATLRTVQPEPFVDGLAIVGYRVTNLGFGRWRYEYAVYNMNLDRSIRLFRVPVPSGVIVTNIGFHAPLNHAPEPGADTYSNDAWEVSTTTGAVEWSTATFDEDPLANAIRFGTLYNFRFDADISDRDTEATLGFFKTGEPQSVAIRGPALGPSDCNQNGINDACDFACSNAGCDVPGCGGSLDCNSNTIPDECDIDAGRALDCNGDGVPDGCTGCADDCECDDGVSCTSGICVSGMCIQEVLCDVGMICDAKTETCRPCLDSEECDDGDPCTNDVCTLGQCSHPPESCLPGLVCDSSDGECKECVSDGDCSPGQVCDTTAGTCEECVAADDCDDGVFCNGSEACVGNQCRPGGDPCPGRQCRSSDDRCVDCLSASDCDNADPCDGIESCSESGICESGAPQTDCNNNGVEDGCDIDAGVAGDCQPNGILDVCDITAGTSLDENGDGVPDECLACTSNADCLDSLVCTFDLCVDATCVRQNGRHGDVAGPGGACGPDGQVDLVDILAVLDAFQGVFAPPCTLPNLDIACGPGASCCAADGTVDLLDILAVLNAFQGLDDCCTVGR